MYNQEQGEDGEVECIASKGRIVGDCRPLERTVWRGEVVAFDLSHYENLGGCRGAIDGVVNQSVDLEIARQGLRYRE